MAFCKYLFNPICVNKITWLVHRAWWEATNLGDGVFRLTLTLLLKEILGGLANSSSDEENMRCWYFGGLLALSQENCLSFFFIMGTSGRFNRGGLKKKLDIFKKFNCHSDPSRAYKHRFSLFRKCVTHELTDEKKTWNSKVFTIHIFRCFDTKILKVLETFVLTLER